MKNKERLIKAFEKLKNALRTCSVGKLEEMISGDYKGFSLNGTIEVKFKYFVFCVLESYISQNLNAPRINGLH